MKIIPNRKKAFLTHASGAYILTIISMIKGLFLLPFYFQYISYNMYGYWITLLGIVSILSIINFGIGVMSMQRISKAYALNDFNSMGGYFINSLVIYLIISFVFLLCGFFTSIWLSNIFHVSKEELEILEISFYLLLLSKFISFFSDAFRGLAVSLLKPLFDIYVMVGANLFGLLLVVILIYEGIGLLALPISLIITELIIVFLSSIYARLLIKEFEINLKIRYEIIKEYFKYSANFFNLTIGNKLLESSHPIIITTFIGAEITAAYDVTKKVIELILTALNILGGALLAPFSHLVGEGNSDLINNTVIKIILFSIFSGLVGFGTYAVTNEMFVNLWINDDMLLSQSVIVFLALSAFTFSLNRLLRNLLIGFNEIKFATNSVLLEGILYTILSIVFITTIGIIGLPIAFLIASILVIINLGNKLRLIIDLKIDYYQVLKFFSMLFFICIFLFKVQMYFIELTWIGFLVKAGITVVGIVIIILLFNYFYFFKKIKK